MKIDTDDDRDYRKVLNCERYPTRVNKVFIISSATKFIWKNYEYRTIIKTFKGFKQPGLENLHKIIKPYWFSNGFELNINQSFKKSTIVVNS